MISGYPIWLVLCDPMDCKLLCPWILQARILESVAIPLLQGRVGCHIPNPGIKPTSLTSPALGR